MLGGFVWIHCTRIFIYTDRKSVLLSNFSRKCYLKFLGARLQDMINYTQLVGYSCLTYFRYESQLVDAFSYYSCSFSMFSSPKQKKSYVRWTLNPCCATIRQNVKTNSWQMKRFSAYLSLVSFIEIEEIVVRMLCMDTFYSPINHTAQENVFLSIFSIKKRSEVFECSLIYHTTSVVFPCSLHQQQRKGYLRWSVNAWFATTRQNVETSIRHMEYFLDFASVISFKEIDRMDARRLRTNRLYYNIYLHRTKKCIFVYISIRKKLSEDPRWSVITYVRLYWASVVYMLYIP